MSTDASPWYRHGWVWFVLALPAAVVVASFVTLYIAIANPSSLVREDYYRDGLGINRKLEQARNARARGLQATLEFERTSGTLRVRVTRDDLPVRLALALLHPTDGERDSFLVLERSTPGVYEVRVPAPPDGRRHIQLAEPGDASAWQLQGTWDARTNQPATLLPADG